MYNTFLLKTKYIYVDFSKYVDAFFVVKTRYLIPFL